MLFSSRLLSFSALTYKAYVALTVWLSASKVMEEDERAGSAGFSSDAGNGMCILPHLFVCFQIFRRWSVLFPFILPTLSHPGLTGSGQYPFFSSSHPRLGIVCRVE